MSYLVVGGVCRPQTFAALDLYKGIQREANRLLDAMEAPLIYVDGRIGSKTIAAVNKVLGAQYKSCEEIARGAKAVLSSLATRANSMNAAVIADPDNIVRSIVSPPSKVENGKVVHPTSFPWLLVAAGAAGGAYYYYKKGR